jgi:cell division protein FtsW (lipid II flippase)
MDFGLRNECPLDPKTGQRLGPSTLSTVFVALYGLGLVSTTAALLRDMAREERLRYFKGHIALLVLSLVVVVVGFVLYVTYYQRCRPWFGWFIFITGCIIMATILGTNRREDDDFWRSMG